jgi:4-amino-4-deoxy-L-arabinose transferase-like glycosyltransferase
MDTKKIFFACLIFLILAGVFMSICSLNKDISAEESDYVNSARAIVDTGHPLFYQFEQKAEYELGLWHPPMYIYSLSLIALYSTSEIALRSLNFIFTLFTAILIFLFCAHHNVKGGKSIGLLAAALFLINYYVFSSSTLIDIDVFSMFFVLLFFYSILSYHKTSKKIYWVLAALSFFFGLANRYPIMIIVFLSTWLYFFIRKETRKFSLKFFFAGFFGGILFLDIWALYSTLIEPGTFFIFVTHSTQLGASQFSNIPLYLASFCLNLAQITRLFTLPVVILFIISSFYLIRRKEEYIRLVLIYSWGIFLFFVFIPRPAFGYPRYFLTMMPGLFILIAIFLYENIKKINPPPRKYLFIALFFALCLFLLIVVSPHTTIYRSDGLILSTNLPDLIFNILCLAPIVLVLCFGKKERKLFLIFALVGSLLAYSFYFDIKTTLNDSQIEDVAEYLKQNTAGDLIMAPKAIGYYYDERFYANDFYRPALNKISTDFIITYLRESLKDPNMKNSFFWGDDLYGGINYFGDLQPEEGVYNTKYIVVHYASSEKSPEKIIGDYYIYHMHD